MGERGTQEGAEFLQSTVLGDLFNIVKTMRVKLGKKFFTDRVLSTNHSIYGDT